MTNKELAIKYMKELNIYKPYIDKFNKENIVTLFERYAGFYQHPDYTEETFVYDKIKEVEKEHNCIVYAITHEILSDIGEMYSFLIIPNEMYEGEEYLSKANFNSYYALAYVYNVDYPEFSEMGDIIVDSFGGGIRRKG